MQRLNFSLSHLRGVVLGASTPPFMVRLINLLLDGADLATYIDDVWVEVVVLSETQVKSRSFNRASA